MPAKKASKAFLATQKKPDKGDFEKILSLLAEQTEIFARGMAETGSGEPGDWPDDVVKAYTEKRAALAVETARDFTLEELTPRLARLTPENTSPAAALLTLQAVSLVVPRDATAENAADDVKEKAAAAYRKLYRAAETFARSAEAAPGYDTDDGGEAIALAFDIFAEIAEKCETLKPAVRASVEKRHAESKTEAFRAGAEHVAGIIGKSSSAPEEKIRAAAYSIADILRTRAEEEKEVTTDSWHALFRKKIVYVLNDYQSAGGTDADEVFGVLYKYTKAAFDSYLTVANASSAKTLHRCLIDALAGIATHNPATGEAVMRDLRDEYMKDGRDFIRTLAGDIAKEITKRQETGIRTVQDPKKIALTPKEQDRARKRQALETMPGPPRKE